MPIRQQIARINHRRFQIRSVGYGWGVLCLAGGGAYYFAKRSINSDREQRAAAEEQRRQQRERLRATEALSRETALNSSSGKERASRKPAPNANNTSGNGDPAPVAHAEDGGEGTGGGGEGVVKGKFEASEPFRSRKGDRFS